MAIFRDARTARCRARRKFIFNRGPGGPRLGLCGRRAGRRWKHIKDTIGMRDGELLYYSQPVNPRLTGGHDFHSQYHQGSLKNSI
jgi:hypothetical protein